MTRRAPAVVGLDLSLRGSAGVMIPGDWSPGDWSAIRSFRYGYPIKDRTPQQSIEREIAIGAAVLAFLRECGTPHVFAEDVIPAMNGLRAAKLFGHVECEAYRELGVTIVPVNQSTARKQFLGKLPKSDRGSATAVALKRLGWPWADQESDRGDALVIASWGRGELGLPALVAY